jgi:hypothetical protein
MKRSFADVTVDKEQDNAINTSEFLEAAESLTKLFGMCCSHHISSQLTKC